MDKELRKIKELSETNARQTQFYKRLIKRTYRRIKGYPDYKQIAVDLATHLMCLETGFELRGFSDTAWNAMSHSAWMAYENPIFPVFAITKELAEAFLQTDLPSHVCSVKKSFSTALFLLPDINTLAGKIVLSIGCDMRSDEALELPPETKEKLDELHLRKIDLTDEVLTLNVGGYVGESTSRELAYAQKLGKESGFWSRENYFRK